MPFNRPLMGSSSAMESFDLNAANRRTFMQSAAGLGSIALASLVCPAAFADSPGVADDRDHRSLMPHFAAKAKRVIYLFQSGAPSQMDLFDWKPKLADLRATELPDSIRQKLADPRS